MSIWKRGFLDITADILKNLLNKPMKKTQISSKCNLDSRAVTKYLTQLKALDFVGRSNTDHTIYIVTQKGNSFVSQYQLLIDMIENDLIILIQKNKRIVKKNI